MERRNNKRGQISIFVIVSIIIVIGVVLFFLFNRGPVLNTTNPVVDPVGFISNCLEKPIEDSIDEVREHGGYVNAEDANHIIRYNFTDIAFLCYAGGRIENCVNQEPLLVGHVESELETDLFDDVEGCFESLEGSLRRYGYTEGPSLFEVEILPGKVDIIIEKEISFVDSEEVREFSDFDFSVENKIYRFLEVTQEILNEEASADCNFGNGNADIISLQRSNRDLELERFISGENEKIYTLRDLEKEKEFVFAVRNCVRLP